jgi:hypothetical protein
MGAQGNFFRALSLRGAFGIDARTAHALVREGDCRAAAAATRWRFVRLDCFRIEIGIRKMAQAAPQFPSLDVWEGMSEQEQDALLDHIEMVRRRKLLWSRLQAGFALGAAALCLSGLLYLALMAG